MGHDLLAKKIAGADKGVRTLLVSFLWRQSSSTSPSDCHSSCLTSIHGPEMACALLITIIP